jgi:ABC-type transporter MlaC component
MNKTILCILSAVLIVSFGAIKARASTPSDAVLSYFQALKNGDVETIKASITGDMYKKRKVLLEQNKNYPEFLKNVYKGAQFRIKDVSIKDNDAVVSVEVIFPDRKTQFILYLIKDDLGNWKIFKENSDQ